MADCCKRLFCNHEYILQRWHWTHGINGNEPRLIEAEWKCHKCGKVSYCYPKRGSERERWYEKTQRDKKA